MNALPLDQILQGDCVSILDSLPAASVDLIFADPPYNLQLQQALLRPNQTRVDGVEDEWDKFADFATYDAFTRAWLSACRRVLKDDGTLWVIGSYHNIYRVGSLLQDLGYWILNEVVWHKTNPMPNFRGARFTNATETLIWAARTRDQKRYTFNYQAMKQINDGKQMQNVWQLPLCTGAERLKIDGKKAHSTQKPEALLYRVIMSASAPGAVVLDPFFGSGTTGAVAKKLGRHFIGIAREPRYVALARARIDAIVAGMVDESLLRTPSKRDQPRVSLGTLVEAGYLTIGQPLYAPDRAHCAVIAADGSLLCGDLRGSLHQVAAALLGQGAHNGWDYWSVESGDGALIGIDTLRDRYRREQMGR